MVFLHAPGKLKSAQGVPKHLVRVIVAKQRNGATGDDDFFLQGEFCRLLEKDWQV